MIWTIHHLKLLQCIHKLVFLRDITIWWKYELFVDERIVPFAIFLIFLVLIISQARINNHLFSILNLISLIFSAKNHRETAKPKDVF
jgi:hypothetical protein